MAIARLHFGNTSLKYPYLRRLVNGILRSQPSLQAADIQYDVAGSSYSRKLSSAVTKLRTSVCLTRDRPRFQKKCTFDLYSFLIISMCVVDRLGIQFTDVHGLIDMSWRAIVSSDYVQSTDGVMGTMLILRLI